MEYICYSKKAPPFFFHNPTPTSPATSFNFNKVVPGYRLVRPARAAFLMFEVF